MVQYYGNQWYVRGLSLRDILSQICVSFKTLCFEIRMQTIKLKLQAKQFNFTSAKISFLNLNLKPKIGRFLHAVNVIRTASVIIP